MRPNKRPPAAQTLLSWRNVPQAAMLRAGSENLAMTNDAIDTDRIDHAVLALLLLGLHNGQRAWKGFDWDALGRLHEKGLISDPVGRAKFPRAICRSFQ